MGWPSPTEEAAPQPGRCAVGGNTPNRGRPTTTRVGSIASVTMPRREHDPQVRVAFPPRGRTPRAVGRFEHSVNCGATGPERPSGVWPPPGASQGQLRTPSMGAIDELPAGPSDQVIADATAVESNHASHPKRASRADTLSSWTDSARSATNRSQNGWR
jgi:hypothetical protein